PAHVTDHNQEPNRKQFDIGKLPDDLLQPNHLAEFVVAKQLTNLYCRLASCHNSSISVIFDSEGVLPRSASFFSMCVQRARNLVLVRRRACSGSTLTKRARLTSTKRRSPSSFSSSACAASDGLAPSAAAAWRASANSASSS